MSRHFLQLAFITGILLSFESEGKVDFPVTQLLHRLCKMKGAQSSALKSEMPTNFGTRVIDVQEEIGRMLYPSEQRALARTAQDGNGLEKLLVRFQRRTQELKGLGATDAQLAKWRIEDSAFAIDRYFWEYHTNLGSTFADDIKSLGPDDIWLDAGAGNANAQAEYLMFGSSQQIQSKESLAYIRLPPLEKRANVIAYGYEKPNPFIPLSEAAAKKFTAAHGTYFEKIPDRLLKRFEGKISVITSDMGVFSYWRADEFSHELSRLLPLLKDGGKIHIETSGANFAFVGPSGKAYSAKEALKRRTHFLESINGVKVLEFQYGTQVRIVLQRTKGEIHVPPLIGLKHNDEAPPWRNFFYPSYPDESYKGRSFRFWPFGQKRE